MDIYIVVALFAAFYLSDVFCKEIDVKELPKGFCLDEVSDVRKNCVPGRKPKCKTEIVKHKKKICCANYKYDAGNCVPIAPKCDATCVNAKCTGVKHCACDDGFERLNDTHCIPPCPAGFYNDYSDPALSCISECIQPCLNGTCTDFDTCICDAGYKLKTNSKFECEPDCKTCENGICIAPNSCVCNIGYTDEHDGKCRPVCIDCDHGDCIAPNSCVCNTGYTDEHDGKCRPVCIDCAHGDCIAPNSCVCNTGYTDEHDGKCRPVCIDCDHGDCIAPNNCQCHDGYTKQGKVCVPVCGRECANGRCTAPDVCTCDANYTLDAANKFKCKPTCVNKCINATCVSPDTCACAKGFVPTENSWTCRPKCDLCDNGVCVAPNKCRCNKGYAKNDSDICLPICSDTCVNGFCSAPEQCKCNLGYEGHNDCTPVCKERCVNSTCVGPDECACWSGYSFANSTAACRPVCSACRNGQCVAPELCLCDAGYEKVNSTCVPVPMINCKWCESACNDSVCACANGTACDSTEQAGVASTPTLAGLQLTWMLGGAVGLLLLVFVVVVLHRTWRQRKTFDKAADSHYNAYGESVVYTVPNTLVRQEGRDDENEADYDEVESRPVEQGLLRVPSRDQVDRM